MSRRNEQRVTRTVVVYRVCQHWRAPMFARLNAEPDIDLTVLHGRSIPGTKLVNATSFEGFRHKQLFGFGGEISAAGRKSVWVVCPLIGFTLLRLRPDVIVAEGGSNVFTNFFVFAYAILFRTPVVWWTLGELRGREFRGIRRLYAATIRTMERLSTVLLGYSSVALNRFSRMGYPREKWFRAVNCVDTDRVIAEIESRCDQAGALREKLGLVDRRVVLFVGALTDEKKVDRLVRAFATVRGRVERSHLLIVGDGPARARLTELAEQLGVHKDVTFAGHVVEGVSDYFELGDVFVLPGLGGLAISEAMAHGLPVICGVGDGCEVDLVRDGVSGFRTDANGDEEVIAFLKDRLTQILASPERLEQMGAAARAVIDDQYNVNTYIAHVADAIRYAHHGRRETPMPEIAPL